ncbi:MAG: S8 family serine peptidase [Coriobacteriales bacterium]|jgi:hypothetical protein
MRFRSVVAMLSLACALIVLVPGMLLAAEIEIDLAPFQWSLANTGRAFVTPSMSTSFNLESLGWNDSEQPLSSSGTIAILSTGVDESHPELEDAFLDMTAFTDEGGAHGVNAYALATGEGDTADLADQEGTGTHCAGIIAAAWDGTGTSGISNDTKIIPIKVTDDEGRVSLDAVAAAYDYLDRAMGNGLVVTAVCNPWPAPRADKALLTAVNKLGRRGAVSIFASGDEGADLDGDRLASGETGAAVDAGQDEDVLSLLDVALRASWVADSPYAIVVNSSGIDSSRSWFTNVGVTSTDLFAPGEEILSTVPVDAGAYLPEADGNPTLAETFDGGTSGSVAFAIANAEALEKGNLAEAVGVAVGAEEEEIRFDGLQEGGGALEVAEGELTDLAGDDSAKSGSPSSRGVLLAIPVPDSGNIADLSIGFHVFSQCLSQDAPAKITVRMQVADEDDSISWSPAGDDCPASLTGNIGTTWHALSFEVADAVAAAGGGEPVLIDRDDDGEADTLYLLLVLENTSGPLYLDSLGVGEKRVPYDYRSGSAQAAAYTAGATSVL